MNRFSRIAAIMVAVVGAAVLVGWLFDIVLLTNVVGVTSMKANTALLFLAAGVAVWAVHRATSGYRSLARVLSIAVTVTGGVTLAEDLFSIDVGIDQLLFLDARTSAPLRPGRMSPAAALSFVFVGFALLALSARRSHLIIARGFWFALPPFFISSVAVVGYAYNVNSLYTVGTYTSMAAHTAVCFIFLSLSILAADPKRGIANILGSNTAGGVVARRLLRPSRSSFLDSVGCS